MMLSRVLARLDVGLDHSIERLFELLKYKSVSTDPEFRENCRETADWLVKDLKTIGFDASRRDTIGHPVVIAHHDGPNADALHVLFYGHYDVQPVDPLALWEDDPFNPKIKERNGHKVISARGASDDKGQMMTFIEAVRAYKQETGQLPVRVTILLEGEEESGSSSLYSLFEMYGNELKADYALVCDTSMWHRDTPSISVSLRGLLGEEVIINAANRDLHSGYYGGAAANPIHILARILADLHDQNGRVTILGFYEGVEEIPEQILTAWKALNLEARQFLKPIGLSLLAGEKGRDLFELVWTRPTAEVNGISGGYEGDGFKTVIAAKASAKVSFRLVHKQNPLKIRKAFRTFVRSRIPADCTVEFLDHGASPAIQLSFDSPLITCAKTALSEEWPNPAVLVAMGGSIPVVSKFRSLLGMECLLVGFALDDDCIHSPNEKYDVNSFHKGQRSWARILAALST
ncbi:MAG: Acetylornithine deacetylase [Candidatus Tokpelaia sp. JSC188]|nr:MAG: Acetylornithine deacetylase [Candidatus Tokpelaia sp. JSC188]